MTKLFPPASDMGEVQLPDFPGGSFVQNKQGAREKAMKQAAFIDLLERAFGQLSGQRVRVSRWAEVEDRRVARVFGEIFGCMEKISRSSRDPERWPPVWTRLEREALKELARRLSFRKCQDGQLQRGKRDESTSPLNIPNRN